MTKEETVEASRTSAARTRADGECKREKGIVNTEVVNGGGATRMERAIVRRTAGSTVMNILHP